MKTTFGTIHSAPLVGIAAIVLALYAFTPVSRAGIIVDNTGNLTDLALGGEPFGQVFSPSANESLSSVTLELNSDVGGTVAVYLYNTSGGRPDLGPGIFLGNVTLGSSGDQAVTLDLLSEPLVAGTQYAIVLQNPTSGSIAWRETQDSSASGSGTMFLGYGLVAGSWETLGGGLDYLQMQVTSVPEVPGTGAVMGFGALAIAVGGALRCKFRPAGSSIR